ncbi:MAG TPA: mechanosensitive ion channel domain-containing protein [Candidatus Angelobacter sp.]
MKNSVRFFVVLVWLSLVTAARAQTAAHQAEKPGQQSEPHAAEATEANDPLGRSTPHGTVFGFLQAAQSGKYREAAQYLQLSKRERATRGERIARQLHALMDNAFVGRVGAISNHREGSVQAGIAQDHERIGVFEVNGSETNVDLVHVSDPEGGEIWLFSSQILVAVPGLFGQIEENQAESRLPRFLVTTEVFSTPLWRLAAFLLLIVVSFGLAWAVVRLLRAGLRVWLRRRPHPVLEDIRDSFGAPAILIFATIFQQIGVRFLGAPLLIRAYSQRVAGLILVAGIAWLVVRVINRWGERARIKSLAGSGYRSGSIILLGQRIFNALVVIVAGLIMLSILGFDITTAVAGLGIGSIAIAFAAQKTLENLLGGISILGDQVIRVGETCRIGDKIGTVEDISLRSTRIRTLERTELSVPNGQLANMNVENLSRSNTSLFRTNIGLRHETSPDQLRSLLKEIPDLLRRHPKVDPEITRVRFIGFGESSLDVQIHCLILTGSLKEFLAIREELLLQIMDLAARAGVGFATPARILYMAQDQELDQQRTATVPSIEASRSRRAG